ncbi:MAG: hypothetical protein WCY12_03580, partial [Candidatus Omnitrophota bacterium]
MKKNKIVKLISLFICFSLLFEQSGFAQVAGTLNLSAYMSAVGSVPVADKFRPLHLRYLSYDSKANNFKLLLDKGDFAAASSLRGARSATKQSLANDNAALQVEAKTLLKYFLIG